MRNGPDRCCRTCRTWSKWWYWFCRRTSLPKTPTYISLKPIPKPSLSFRSPIYLYYCYSTTTPRFFEFRASKLGISYRIASHHRAELNWVFVSEISSVLFCAWNGYVWSLLLVVNLRSQRCSLCSGLSFLVFIILSEGPHFWH